MVPHGLRDEVQAILRVLQSTYDLAPAYFFSFGFHSSLSAILCQSPQTLRVFANHPKLRGNALCHFLLLSFLGAIPDT